MRSSALPQVVDAVREPIRRFVRESKVRVAVLMSSSGQIVAQHGFTQGYEIVNVASLAAAANAAAGTLAQLAGVGRWRYMYHAGSEHQLFLAPVELPGSELVLVAIFDSSSSVGLAQFFFDQLATQLQALAVFETAAPTQDPALFEKDLEAAIRIFLSREDSGEA